MELARIEGGEGWKSLPGRKIWRGMRWIWRFEALKPGKTSSTSLEHSGPLDPDRRDSEHQHIEISDVSEKEREGNTQRHWRPNARNFSPENRAVRAASPHGKPCLTGCPSGQVRATVGLLNFKMLPFFFFWYNDFSLNYPVFTGKSSFKS